MVVNGKRLAIKKTTEIETTLIGIDLHLPKMEHESNCCSLMSIDIINIEDVEFNLKMITLKTKEGEEQFYYETHSLCCLGFFFLQSRMMYLLTQAELHITRR